MKIDKFGTDTDIRELLDIRDELGVLLGAQVARDPLLPRADLIDVGESYLLQVEVPGVQLSDLEIAATDDEFQVAGIREMEFEDGDRLFSERPVGPFQRTFELPHDADAQAATAHLAAGVLTVTLPKRS